MLKSRLKLQSCATLSGVSFSSYWQQFKRIVAMFSSEWHEHLNIWQHKYGYIYCFYYDFEYVNITVLYHQERYISYTRHINHYVRKKYAYHISYDVVILYPLPSSHLNPVQLRRQPPLQYPVILSQFPEIPQAMLQFCKQFTP